MVTYILAIAVVCLSLFVLRQHAKIRVLKRTVKKRKRLACVRSIYGLPEDAYIKVHEPTVAVVAPMYANGQDVRYLVWSDIPIPEKFERVGRGSIKIIEPRMIELYE